MIFAAFCLDTYFMYNMIMLKNAPSVYMVVVFSLLAALSLTLFGVLQITTEHNAQLGYLELAGAAAAILNLLLLKFTQNVRLVRNLLLLVILSFLLVMLVTGGTQGTGIFWYFVFPVSAFFLAGGKGGAYWLAGLASATLVILVLSEIDIVDIPYSVVVIRQLLLCLAVVGAGIYAYQKAREKYEQQRKIEAQKLEEAKNEFLALASHQLRTPISAISWFSEMLLHGDAGALTEEQSEHIKQIYASNRRSAAIVDAIIMISNLQTGKLGIRSEMINIHTLSREVIEEQLSAQPVARKLKIHEEYSANTKEVQGDPILIRTIIRNLISNAIKYTSDKGEIYVFIKMNQTTSSKKGEEDALHIEVADTGYGIPKGEQHKIFAKLFRASNIKAKDTDGTGLGLYVVKAILGQIGGEIKFKSQENKGSIFTVSIPLVHAHKGDNKVGGKKGA